MTRSTPRMSRKTTPAWALPRKVFQDLRASYWFVPGFMAILAFGLAIGSEYLDRRGWADPYIPSIFYVQNADIAQSILGVIAPASIGAAGVMFSMTMVAVSFASSNIGPRLIGNFMQDRGVQFSLGTLLATFIYSLMILRSLRMEDQGFDYVPILSMTISMGLVLISVGVMIYFVHHIPEIISLENVTAALGQRLLTQIAELTEFDASDHEEAALEGRCEELRLDHAGYLQAVNFQALNRMKRRGEWRVKICKFPGDFVAPHMPVAIIATETPLKDRQRSRLGACFALGTARTEAQNPAFIADQLSEIVARALSPGVNDPYTAMSCLNWAHAALHALAGRGPLDPLGFDHDDARRTLNFTGLLKVTHEIPRSYIAADVLVTRHAHDLLKDLANALPDGPRRDAVMAEIKDLLSEAKGLLPHAPDIADLSPQDPAPKPAV